MRSDLGEFYVRCKYNNMPLNSAKCKQITFCRVPPIAIAYFIDTHVCMLDCVLGFTNPGLILDRKLNVGHLDLRIIILVKDSLPHSLARTARRLGMCLVSD